MKKPKLNLTGLADSFRTRSFRVGSYSVAATVIVLAIAVVINLMAAALPASLTEMDTTSQQLFTISEQTETILSGLEADVTIYWIAQSGYEDVYIETLLNRYESLSDRIRVVKKDPNVYPTFVQQYASDGVTDNSLIVECGERYRYVDYYEIYVYDYSYYYYTGEYTVSFAGESSLTSAIDYCISEDLPKVYLLTGHGEMTMADTFADAVGKENIETAELSLVTAGAVPEDADCIMIYAPQSDIAEAELELLRSYMAEGGKLMLITDPPQDGSLTNLEALMGDYGITAAEGVLVEGDQSYYAWNTPYYLLPDYGSHDITDPLLECGYYVLLPIAQGLQVGTAPNGVTVTELLLTSDAAFSKVAGYGLTTYEKEVGDLDGPFSLAVAVADDNTGAAAVWIASSSVLDEDVNDQISGGNQDLFLNALNWMCEPEGGGLTIHAKELTYDYLTMDSSTAASLTVLMVVLIPALYLGIGIVVLVGRKRR